MNKRLINHFLDEIAVARSQMRAQEVRAIKAEGLYARTESELRALMETRGCPWPDGQTLTNAVVEMLDAVYEQGRAFEVSKAELRARS